MMDDTIQHKFTNAVQQVISNIEELLNQKENPFTNKNTNSNNININTDDSDTQDILYSIKYIILCFGILIFVILIFVAIELLLKILSTMYRLFKWTIIIVLIITMIYLSFITMMKLKQASYNTLNNLTNMIYNIKQISIQQLISYIFDFNLNYYNMLKDISYKMFCNILDKMNVFN